MSFGRPFRPARASTALALATTLAGCYSLQPVHGPAPVVGTDVAFDVNDAGRVALGGSMGPELAQVQGRLLAADSAGYTLAVSAVALLRGGQQVWSGERVVLRREHLGNAYERHFSAGRSIVLGVATVGGFTAFLITKSLLGSSTSDGHLPPPDSVVTRLVRP